MLGHSCPAEIEYKPHMQYVSSMYIYNNETGEIKYILFNLIYPKYHFDIIYIKLLVGHLVFFLH